MGLYRRLDRWIHDPESVERHRSQRIAQWKTVGKATAHAGRMATVGSVGVKRRRAVDVVDDVRRKQWKSRRALAPAGQRREAAPGRTRTMRTWQEPGAIPVRYGFGRGPEVPVGLRYQRWSAERAGLAVMHAASPIIDGDMDHGTRRCSWCSKETDGSEWWCGHCGGDLAQVHRLVCPANCGYDERVIDARPGSRCPNCGTPLNEWVPDPVLDPGPGQEGASP